MNGETVRPNGERARIAVILLCVVIVVELVVLVSDYLQYNLLNEILLGDFAMEEAESSDRRQQIVGIISIVVFVASGVTFINWFRRAYYNLHVKFSHLGFQEQHALWSWFIPILSLFRPYRIMKEIYYRTELHLSKNAAYGASGLTHSVVGWWWTLWIVNNLVGQFVFRTAMSAETSEEFINNTIASMVSSLIGIASALLAIQMIRDYAAVEPLLAIPDEEPEAENLDTPILSPIISE